VDLYVVWCGNMVFGHFCEAVRGVCTSSVRTLFRVKWSRVFNECLLIVDIRFGDASFCIRISLY
jgi:hypothetical protein